MSDSPPEVQPETEPTQEQLAELGAFYRKALDMLPAAEALNAEYVARFGKGPPQVQAEYVRSGLARLLARLYPPPGWFVALELVWQAGVILGPLGAVAGVILWMAGLPFGLAACVSIAGLMVLGLCIAAFPWLHRQRQRYP